MRKSHTVNTPSLVLVSCQKESYIYFQHVQFPLLTTDLRTVPDYPFFVSLSWLLTSFQKTEADFAWSQLYILRTGSWTILQWSHLALTTLSVLWNSLKLYPARLFANSALLLPNIFFCVTEYAPSFGCAHLWWYFYTVNSYFCFPLVCTLMLITRNWHQS